VFILPAGGGKEIAMRRLLAILGGFVLVLAIGTGTSNAQEFRHYPWCLFSGGSESSFESCSFDSFAQCMMTRSGGGGICFANPAYRAVIELPRQKPRRRRA
jgi:hypothetical protein